jgi:hypothetical protein
MNPTHALTASAGAALAALVSLGAAGVPAASASTLPPPTLASATGRAPTSASATTAAEAKSAFDGLGASPAPGSPDLAARGAYFSLHLAPGQSFTGHLLVINGSASTTTVKIGAVPGLTSPNGSGAVYADTPGGMSSWVNSGAPSEALKPHSRTIVPFTLTVPSKVTPGDHLVGVVVEGPPHGLAKAVKGKTSMQVKVQSRIVVGVLVDTPGPQAFTATVGHPYVTTGPEGIGEILTPIHDTGRLLAQPNLKVTVTTAGTRKTLGHATGTILPGGYEKVPVFWPTSLQGKVALRSCIYGPPLTHEICSANLVNLTQKTVVAPKPGQVVTRVISTGISTGVIIAIVVGVLVLAALIGILLFLLLAKRRKDDAKTAEATPPAGPSQDDNVTV